MWVFRDTDGRVWAEQGGVSGVLGGAVVPADIGPATRKAIRLRWEEIRGTPATRKGGRTEDADG